MAQWSPDGSCIAVWDSPLHDGVCLYTPEGEYLAQYSCQAASLGIRTVAWSPSSQLLAIGSSDQAREATPLLLQRPRSR
jgi:WD40 repeat protein